MKKKGPPEKRASPRVQPTVFGAAPRERKGPLRREALPRQRFFRLLPAASKREADIHDGRQAFAARGGELHFAVEQRAFRVQHFQIRGIAVVVTRIRQLHGKPQLLDHAFQRGDDIAHLLLAGQGVAHFLEGTLNGLFIGRQRFALLRLGGFDAVLHTPEIKQRHGSSSAVAPRLERIAHQGMQFGADHAEFKRDRARFAAALDDMRVGKLSGAVGTYTVLSPEVEAIVCGLLGLKVDEVSTQVIQRDRHAAYFTALAVTAGTIERLCVELRHLQRTEVREVEEGFGKGQKGSSAMPHKKNPISAENMTGLSRLIRTNALAALENQALWHERDISHSSVERVIMPDSTILTDYVLHRLCRLLEGLRIMPENMARNMECSFGLYFSQRVLTALIETGIPRQEAYVMVQRNAMKSWETRQPFPELIKADPEINSRLSEETFAGLFDPQFYLRHEGDILKRVFEE